MCLLSEPESLYLYGLPEAGREHILAALYDGPLDNAAYALQPALLEDAGAVAVRDVRVEPGDLAVDLLGRARPLAGGAQFLLADGSVVIHTGGSLSLPQMQVTFRLRPGMRWSDGEPLTAGDSVFSYDVGGSPEAFTPRRDLAARTASYTASNERTVVWTGLPGYLAAAPAEHFWTPLPRHLFGSLTPAQIEEDARAMRAPLGWGPFRVSEWAAGERLVLERNPFYFRAGEGLPRLKRLVFRFVPADAASLLELLSSGDCDLVPPNPAFDAAPQLLAQAADDPALSSLQVLSAPSGVLEQLTFGMQPVGDYEPAAGAGFFREPRARQALAHCLDRAALAGQWGLPAESYFPPGHPFLAAEVRPYAFDPAAGRALLSALGWVDADGDGRREREGVPLRLVLAGGPVGDSVRERLLVAAAAQLEQNCGLTVETRPLTTGELAGDWPAGVVFGRRFDLALFGWRVETAPPCELWTTAQIPDGTNPGGTNAAGYSNPDFDAACHRALAALDPGQALRWHQEAQRLFARDLPALPLFFRLRFAAARAAVRGLQLPPGLAWPLSNAEVLTVAP